jgi:hypothetical protein
MHVIYAIRETLSIFFGVTLFLSLSIYTHCTNIYIYINIYI